MSQRTIVLLAIVVPVAALFALFAVRLVQTGSKPAGIGINSVFGEAAVQPRQAPSLTTPLLSGGTASLADMKGKVVMVDFWSSWCPPCREEAPTLARLYPKYKDRGVEFLGVAIWDSEDEVKKFITANGLTYPSGLDSNGKTAIEFGVRGIPEKYFIDRRGNVVRKFIGPVNDEQLAKVLDELLASP